MLNRSLLRWRLRPSARFDPQVRPSALIAPAFLGKPRRQRDIRVRPQHAQCDIVEPERRKHAPTSRPDPDAGAAHQKAPDAILLDLIMPGIGGFGALEAIRKEQLAPGAKIVILSNQGQDSDIEKAKQLAADGYIIKASAIPSEVFAETMRTIESGAAKKSL
ncbi:MAG: hypothetical protein B7W98_03285 [Parcubacteria group bacterium 20-58-5]|nr:MAG: hypothetical protein B7W98_03285 [Parcubacteria group bacterium 20-58-5]